MNFYPQPMAMQPYQPMFQQPQMQQPTVPQQPQYAAQGVPWADSIEEVKNCVTPFGQRTMFMSRVAPKFFIRDVDKNGIAYVSEYDFSLHQEQAEAPAADYITREEMMQELEKIKEQYESLVQPSTPAEVVEPVYVEPAVPRHAAPAAPAVPAVPAAPTAGAAFAASIPAV